MSLSKLSFGLEIIRLEVYLNKEIDYVTESIIELTLHEYCHRVIFIKLCKLTVLRIGYYKRDLKGLCDELEELIFEISENIIEIQYVLLQLSPTIKRVWLSDSFNRKIDLSDLPEEIIFGYEFNQR
jgi:hypothetical protein